MAYFGPTAARDNLKQLHLQHCWELSNQGILSIAHGLPNLNTLSLSGCSKVCTRVCDSEHTCNTWPLAHANHGPPSALRLQVTDDAVEVIAEQLRALQHLDLSWCARISDAALEYIACDLSDSLKELVLDR